MNDPRPNPDDELDALFALARKQRPDTSRAEYAFETRLTARLRDQRQPDPGSIWAKVSWRMIPIFALCVLALGVWRADVVSEVDETASIANVSHPENLNLFDPPN